MEGVSLRDPDEPRMHSVNGRANHSLLGRGVRPEPRTRGASAPIRATSSEAARTDSVLYSLTALTGGASGAPASSRSICVNP